MTKSFPTRRSSDRFRGAGQAAFGGTGDGHALILAAGRAPVHAVPPYAGACRARPRHRSAYTRAMTLLVLLLALRSEEHTSELQSLMRISYAVFCLKQNIFFFFFFSSSFLLS